MKRNYIISILLVVLLASSALFAQGAREKGADFSAVDLENASIESIKDTWDKAVDFYNDNVDSLTAIMDEAIQDRDVKGYTDARTLLRSLSAPVVTKEQTETLVKRIENSSEEEKAEIADFLFEHSRYYHPTLTFSYSYEDGNSSRSFSKSISAVPGTSVEVPSFTVDEGSFKGWGLTEDEVTYEAGEVIDMPYSDTTLYAIFTTGITFRDYVTDTTVFTEGTEAQAPALEAPEGYVFCGWTDQEGNLLEGDTATAEEGKNATYIALWKDAEVSSVFVKNFRDCTVPADHKVQLFVNVSSKGNKSLSDVSVELAAADGLTIVSDNPLTADRLAAGTTASGVFVISVSGESGAEVSTTVTVTDGDGNTWTEPVVLTIR